MKKVEQGYTPFKEENGLIYEINFRQWSQLSILD